MKQYRNAERTKKWIRRAFIELISEKKTIDKITVNELAERADITKTTFCYHYDDIYAVAEEFENELISKLKNIFSKRMAVTTATMGFSSDCEKRSVQVYFLISACVDTVIQYLKGDLASSIDMVGDVIVEAVEKLKRNY